MPAYLVTYSPNEAQPAPMRAASPSCKHENGTCRVMTFGRDQLLESVRLDRSWRRQTARPAILFLAVAASVAALATTGASATGTSARFSKPTEVPNSFGETGAMIAVAPDGLVIVLVPDPSGSASVMDYEVRFPRSTHWRFKQARLPAGTPWTVPTASSDNKLFLLWGAGHSVYASTLDARRATVSRPHRVALFPGCSPEVTKTLPSGYGEMTAVGQCTTVKADARAFAVVVEPDGRSQGRLLSPTATPVSGPTAASNQHGDLAVAWVQEDGSREREVEYVATRSGRRREAETRPEGRWHIRALTSPGLLDPPAISVGADGTTAMVWTVESKVKNVGGIRVAMARGPVAAPQQWRRRSCSSGSQLGDDDHAAVFPNGKALCLWTDDNWTVDYRTVGSAHRGMLHELPVTLMTFFQPTPNTVGLAYAYGASSDPSDHRTHLEWEELAGSHIVRRQQLLYGTYGVVGMAADARGESVAVISASMVPGVDEGPLRWTTDGTAAIRKG